MLPVFLWVLLGSGLPLVLYVLVGSNRFPRAAPVNTPHDLVLRSNSGNATLCYVTVQTAIYHNRFTSLATLVPGETIPLLLASTFLQPDSDKQWKHGSGHGILVVRWKPACIWRG